MHLEPMKEDQIAEAQALTTSFNWPHTVEDWSFAFKAGVGHAAVEKGRLIGTCLTWRLGSGVSTLGLLVVAQEAQGQGLGKTLLRRALADHTNQTVLLHATEQAIKLYGAEGFTPIGEIRQVQGVVLEGNYNEVAGRSTVLTLPGRDLSRDAMQRVFDQDLHASGIDRSKLLAALLPHSDLTLWGSVGASTAFAFTRPFGRGVVIGPLIAPSEEEARLLVSAILDKHVNQFARIDATAEFPALDWLARRGLHEVDRVLAMSNASLPQPDGQEKRYALIGHAFG